MSLMKTENMRGDKIAPCGIPNTDGKILDSSFFKFHILLTIR